MSQTALQLIRTMKQENCDFEWYPTTPEILSCIEKDIRELFWVREDEQVNESVLDIGAGDGRSLVALTEGPKYAIEKSRALLDVLPKDVFVVGTDFHQQTLLDKKVSIIFSNPIYSDFVNWTCKILREANAKVFYAVIPQRWKDNVLIQQEMETRKITSTVLGEFDFLEADRKARGTVHVVRFSLTRMSGNRIGHNSRCAVDPFDLWFSENFKIGGTTSYGGFSEYDAKREAERNLSSAKKGNELVQGTNFVSLLEEFYNRDLEKLMNTYKTLSEIDPQLLIELDVKIDNVKAALKLKVSSLKDVYWHDLINRLTTVTNKLSFASRKKLLDKLFASTHVDFSCSNAHAIIVWVIKNANGYFDNQLIDLVEKMSERANIANYKSNQRTFGDENWRYRFRKPEGLTEYKLEYRVVLENVGGISGKGCGLSDNAKILLNDISTIAMNIGYDTEHAKKAENYDWVSNKKQHFMFKNHTTDKIEELFEAKAFKNGNLHIKFRQDFIMKLNVEFGRLKGWLKSKEAASNELDIPIEEVLSAFGCNYQLPSNSALMLTAA
jgi:hypothetical protein